MFRVSVNVSGTGLLGTGKALEFNGLCSPLETRPVSADAGRADIVRLIRPPRRIIRDLGGGFETRPYMCPGLCPLRDGFWFFAVAGHPCFHLFQEAWSLDVRQLGARNFS